MPASTVFDLLYLRVLHFSFSCLHPIFASRRLPGGGDDGIRTHDPLLAGQVLSQLSYTPIGVLPSSRLSLFFSFNELGSLIRFPSEAPQKLNNN